MKIRQASLGDATKLHQWRNDTLTRSMSRTSDYVPWEIHIAWLSDRLSRQEPHLYIAERSGDALGTFRIDGDEISYTIAPEYRGLGIGIEMLTKAREMFGPLRAEIYSRNVVSIKTAERAGHLVKIID